MNTNFKVESRAGARPGQRILRLDGRLGLDTAPDFLKSVRAETDPVVILDFGGVSYIDSAGVGSLIQTYASFKKADRRLALAQVNERVQAVLQITKVHNLFSHFPTVKDAEDRLT